MPEIIRIVDNFLKGDPELWIAALGALLLVRLVSIAVAKFGAGSVTTFCVQSGFIIGGAYLVISILL